MVIDTPLALRRRCAWLLLAVVGWGCLVGCGTGPLIGVVYTRVKLPLTRDLAVTPMPVHPPGFDRIIEIKEPFSGLGLYARMNSNALGDIARTHGMDPLYFADQEVFSILGIWKTHRVYLYGEPVPDRGEGVASP